MPRANKLTSGSKKRTNTQPKSRIAKTPSTMMADHDHDDDATESGRDDKRLALCVSQFSYTRRMILHHLNCKTNAHHRPRGINPIRDPIHSNSVQSSPVQSNSIQLAR